MCVRPPPPISIDMNQLTPFWGSLFQASYKTPELEPGYLHGDTVTECEGCIVISRKLSQPVPTLLDYSPMMQFLLYISQPHPIGWRKNEHLAVYSFHVDVPPACKATWVKSSVA